MKDVRSTQSFGPLGLDGSASDTEAAPTRRGTRATYEMSRSTRQIEDLQIPDNDAGQSRNNLTELPDLPRLARLARPRPLAGASMRHTTSFEPMAQRLTNAIPTMQERVLQKASEMTRSELLLAIEEKFAGLQEVIAQIVEQLEEFQDDKTPTQLSESPWRARQRFLKAVSLASDEAETLVAYIGVATQQAENQGTQHDTLSRSAYRQLKDYKMALEVYEELTQSPSNSQESFSPDELLLAKLKSIQEKAGTGGSR